MKNLIVFMLGVFAGAVYVSFDMGERISDDTTIACEMYQIWLNTDGDAGWPDYRGQCEHITKSGN